MPTVVDGQQHSSFATNINGILSDVDSPNSGLYIQNGTQDELGDDDDDEQDQHFHHKEDLRGTRPVAVLPSSKQADEEIFSSSPRQEALPTIATPMYGFAPSEKTLDELKDELFGSKPTVIIRSGKEVDESLFDVDDRQNALPKIATPDLGFQPSQEELRQQRLGLKPVVILPTRQQADGLLLDVNTRQNGFSKIVTPKRGFKPSEQQLRQQRLGLKPVVVLPSGKDVDRSRFNVNERQNALPGLATPKLGFKPSKAQLKEERAGTRPVVVVSSRKEANDSLFDTTTPQNALPGLATPKLGFKPSKAQLKEERAGSKPVVVMPSREQANGSLFNTTAPRDSLPAIITPKLGFQPSAAQLKEERLGSKPVVILPDRKQADPLVLETQVATSGVLQKKTITPRLGFSHPKSELDLTVLGDSEATETNRVRFGSSSSRPEGQTRHSPKHPFRSLRKVLKGSRKRIGKAWKTTTHFLVGDETGQTKNQQVMEDLGDVWFGRDWR